MRKVLNWVLSIAITIIPYAAGAYNSTWTLVDRNHVPSKGEARIDPKNYMVYAANEAYLKGLLFSLSSSPQNAVAMELPMPDGSFRSFNVWQASMMPAGLERKYPGIKTFTAVAIDNPAVTAKLDYTEFGFHAMVFDGANTAFIDPYSNIVGEGLYMCHYKRDETRALDKRMQCMVNNNGEHEMAGKAMQIEQTGLPRLEAKVISGLTLRKYRLALSCSHQYADAVAGPTPTKAAVLSAMTTSMNRINGVYERELSITMEFVANEDTLIYIVATGDPFGPINASPFNLLDQNQITCDASIGDANYDMGHVFTTGSGGLSDLGIVCASGDKAQSTTGSNTPTGDGFDIDYVAHEMGHAFGADHTFNNNSDGSCWNNAVDYAAYEPGAGSTIMAYAGICGPDDLQPHSDDYFHAISLLEIHEATIVGTTCGSSIPTGNHASALAPFTTTYNIPYKTPFELMSPGAVDSVTSVTSYCWEQWDLGSFGNRLNNTYVSGPIFRSFYPVLGTIRVFPRIDSVLKGTLSYVTVENKKGEKAPDTARDMLFKLTVRSNHWGNGTFHIPDDSITIHASSTGLAGSYKGFKVTSPSTPVNWTGATTQSVTWDVVGTTSAPVSCSNVNIYVSSDGGYTWPYLVGNFPNNGSASITVPNIATTSAARIKVKGDNNVFFNVNGSNFTITFDPAQPVTLPNNPVNTTTPYLSVNNVQQAEDVKVYPVPADNILYIELATKQAADVLVYNSLGQTIWKGQTTDKLAIPVNTWTKGVYYMQLVYHESGKRIVKPVLIN